MVFRLYEMQKAYKRGAERNKNLVFGAGKGKKV